MKTKGKEEKKGSRWVKMPIWFFAGLYLLSYVAQWINPESFWVLGVFSIGFPLLLAIITILLVVSFLLSSRYRWFLLILWFPGFLELGKFYQIQTEKKNEKEADTIRIVSFNVRAFNRFKWIDSDNVTEQIVQMVKNLDPDVVCFQEFHDKNFKEANSLLYDIGARLHLPYFTANSATGEGILKGPVTFSRYPFVNNKVLMLSENEINGFLLSEIEVEGKKVKVVNFHLASYAINPTQQAIDIWDKESTSLAAMVKLKQGLKERSRQVKKMKELLSENKQTILVGDLNDTPHSYAYNLLVNEFNDLFLEAGSGEGKTYVGKLPSFRIDFMFSSPDIECAKFFVVRQKLSDHYPIVADVKI